VAELAHEAQCLNPLILNRLGPIKGTQNDQEIAPLIATMSNRATEKIRIVC
jgi:hypothetical protein